CGRHDRAHGADVHAPRLQRAPIRRRRGQCLLLGLRRADLAADLFLDLLGAEVLKMRALRFGISWGGLLAGPTAWATSTQLNYALVDWQCQHKVHVIPVAAFV